MAKLTLDDVANLESETTALATINGNSADIETAFENTLSRDGTSPNQMLANLDMNGNRILNHPAPLSDTDLVRVKDIGSGGNVTISITNNDAASIPFTPTGTIAANNVQSAIAEAASESVSSLVPLQSSITTLTTNVSTLSTNVSTLSTSVSTLTTNVATLSASIRERLTTNLTLYVRTDGNDANDGRTNTAGGAYKTIMAAYRYIHDHVDAANNSITIQVGAGTYNEQLQIFGHLVGIHVFNINGDLVTPSNVVINVGNNQIGCYVKDYGCVQLSGLKFTGGSGAQAVTADQFGIVDISNCDMGAHPNGRFMTAQNNGVLNLDAGTINFSGDTLFPLICQASGEMNFSAVATITIPSARAFNTFAFADTLARISAAGVISGAGVAGTTGSRYFSAFNSVINTNGGGANFFPGNSAGTILTGGVYT